MAPRLFVVLCQCRATQHVYALNLCRTCSSYRKHTRCSERIDLEEMLQRITRRNWRANSSVIHQFPRKEQNTETHSLEIQYFPQRIIRVKKLYQDRISSTSLCRILLNMQQYSSCTHFLCISFVIYVLHILNTNISCRYLTLHVTHIYGIFPYDTITSLMRFYFQFGLLAVYFRSQ